MEKNKEIWWNNVKILINLRIDKFKIKVKWQSLNKQSYPEELRRGIVLTDKLANSCRIGKLKFELSGSSSDSEECCEFKNMCENFKVEIAKIQPVDVVAAYNLFCKNVKKDKNFIHFINNS